MQISSYVGLTGTGGVQRSFTQYYAYAKKADPDVVHTIYTHGITENRYFVSTDVRDLSKPTEILRFVRDLGSRKTVVHIYNRTTSGKLALLLAFAPVRKLVVHERGVAWNAVGRVRPVIRFITWKATLVLANSEAARQLLIQRFAVPGAKIRVIHNGVEVSPITETRGVLRETSARFRIGYLGRLDTPKGVHVLIEAVKCIPASERVELVIAGDGPLEAALLEKYGSERNVSFIGAVGNPLAFLETLDLLVVPSIREPLGNVCIEAGMCALPVLASRVDGILEIIEDGISGELIDPTVPVSLKTLGVHGAAPVPEFVFDPRTRTLQSPREIDPNVLAERILKLKRSPGLRRAYGKKLRQTVKGHFSMERYVSELHSIYRAIDNCDRDDR